MLLVNTGICSYHLSSQILQISLAASLDTQLLQHVTLVLTWINHFSIPCTFTPFLQEDRRVVYVGDIPWDTTKEELFKRFSRFGEIKRITLHFRDEHSEG